MEDEYVSESYYFDGNVAQVMGTLNVRFKRKTAINDLHWLKI